MNTPATPNIKPTLPLKTLATALGDPTRWRILQKLVGSDPLMTVELAEQIGVAATNISKHLAVLRKAGIVIQTRAGLYRIAPHWTIPGERAIDLGAAVLRFDHVVD